VKLLVAKSAEA